MNRFEDITQTEAIVKLARYNAKKDFWLFCLFIDYKFFSQREAMLKETADAYTKSFYQTDKEVYRINTSMIRRVGKTYLNLLFSMWCIGNDHTLKIYLVSHSEEKALTFHKDIRVFLNSNKKYYEVFPSVKVVQENATTLTLEGASKPNITSNGLGKGTGSGYNITISDDIYKNYEEARSRRVNERTKSDYHATVASSLEGNRRIEIITNTRWTKGELADDLEKEGYFDEVIKRRALVNGESVVPYLWSTEELKKIQARRPVMFNAMYQQEYTDAERGALNTRLMRYLKPEQIPHGLRVAVLDNKTTGKDFFCVNIYNITQINGVQEIIVEDSIFTQEMNSKELQHRIVSLIRDYACVYAFFEINKDHTYYLDIKDYLKAYGTKCVAFNTNSNKEVRIEMSGAIISDFIYIDTHETEYNAMLNNAITYDMENQNDHDDGIDNLSMFVEQVIRNKTYSRRLGVDKTWLELMD